MDERTRRIGLNEALFREVNARLEGLNQSFAIITDTFEVVCECGDVQCAQQIAVPTDVYTRVREDPTRFLIVPGHVMPDTEDVVEKAERYSVVKKHPGEASEIPRATARD